MELKMLRKKKATFVPFSYNLNRTNNSLIYLMKLMKFSSITNDANLTFINIGYLKYLNILSFFFSVSSLCRCTGTSKNSFNHISKGEYHVYYPLSKNFRKCILSSKALEINKVSYSQVNTQLSPYH